MMIYPLTIGGACILTSILGTFFVKLGKSKNVMNALYKGFIATAIISLIILYPITDYVLGLEKSYVFNLLEGFDILKFRKEISYILSRIIF